MLLEIDFTLVSDGFGGEEFGGLFGQPGGYDLEGERHFVTDKQLIFNFITQFFVVFRSR